MDISLQVLMSNNIFVPVISVSEYPWISITPPTSIPPKDIITHKFVAESSLAFCHQKEKQFLRVELVVFMAVENSNTKVIVLGSKIGKTKLIINTNQLLFPKARIIVAFLFPPASESYVLPLNTESFLFLFLDRNVMVVAIKAETPSNMVVMQNVTHTLDLKQTLDCDCCIWNGGKAIILDNEIQDNKHRKRAKGGESSRAMPGHALLKETTKCYISMAKMHRASVAAMLVLNSTAYAAGK